MIIKIMDAAGANFPGVKYNDKKIEKGSGELMIMKNFPSFINKASGPEKVKNYLKSVSKNEKIMKPQFHAVISTKYQQHSKEELTKIAENVMIEMGYGMQPYIVVFHNDTDNNHIHIVSTRVDKQTGKKINDSYERLKSQRALSTTMDKFYGLNSEVELDKLLNYKVASLSQLETLLYRNGYKLSKNTNDEKTITILKNGVRHKTLSEDQIDFNSSKNDSRKKQIKAILIKYKNIYSNKVFKVEDRRNERAILPEEKIQTGGNNSKTRIDFESELQKKLKDVFGLDMIFHHKEVDKPFGYTIIDHKTASVYKGSEVLKMNELFEFTADKIDKKLFEIIKDYNIPNADLKNIILNFLKRTQQDHQIKDFMLFENKGRKDLETFRKVQFDLREFVREPKNSNDIYIIKDGGKMYAIHTKLHYVGEFQTLIGAKEYQKFMDSENLISINNEIASRKNAVAQAVDNLLFNLMKSSGTEKDPAENELKKKRKKRK